MEVKQVNMFGGYDDTMDEVDIREVELLNRPEREIKVIITIKVPDAYRNEIDAWIKNHFLGTKCLGVMTRFKLKYEKLSWRFSKSKEGNYE